MEVLEVGCLKISNKNGKIFHKKRIKIWQLVVKISLSYQLGYTFSHFLFENGMNMILLIVLVEISGGIIIDQFSSLREEDDKKRDDMIN
jgi:hypothetical protein